MREYRKCVICGILFKCKSSLRSKICTATKCRIERKLTVRERKAEYDKTRKQANKLAGYKPILSIKVYLI